MRQKLLEDILMYHADFVGVGLDVENVEEWMFTIPNLTMFTTFHHFVTTVYNFLQLSNHSISGDGPDFTTFTTRFHNLLQLRHHLLQPFTNSLPLL